MSQGSADDFEDDDSEQESDYADFGGERGGAGTLKEGKDSSKRKMSTREKK